MEDIREFEVRWDDQGDGNTVFGYGIRWDSPSQPISERGRVFTETFARDSVKTEGKDIRLLAHHDPTQILARTASGTLKVGTDGQGLWFRASLPDTSTGRDMKELLKRGDISKMSFGFKPIKDKWSGDMKLRTVTEADVFELSLVGTPAYQSTSANLRDIEVAKETITMEQNNNQNDAIEALRAELNSFKGEFRKYDTAPAVITSNKSGDSETRAYFDGLVKGDLRSLTTSSSNAPVPTDLERAVWEKVARFNTIRKLSTPVLVDSNRKIAVEGTLPTTALVLEGGTITPADPSFTSQISVGAYKFVTATKFSQEYMEDVIGNNGIGSGLNYLSDKMAISLANKLDYYHTVGSGSSEPEGCMGASASTAITTAGQVVDLTGAAYTTLTSDNLIDCFFKLPAQYRANATWVMSDAVLNKIRKLTDSNGRYLFNDVANGDLTAGVGMTLMGRPITVAADALTATTNGNIFVLFADMSKYFGIWDRKGMQSLLDPYSSAATGYSTLYNWARTDSRILLPEAAAAITC